MPDVPTLVETVFEHRYWYAIMQCGCTRDDENGDTIDRREHAEHVAIAWRKACTIATAEDLDRVPATGIVRSAAGTIACRFDGRNGVVFGDDRPFPWHKLALPALLIWHPSWEAA